MGSGKAAILLVDGEPEPASALARALAMYRTAITTSNLAGLSAIESERFDLVLVTCCRSPRPPLSALEVLRYCKELRPSTRRILIAGEADIPELLRAKAEGLFDRVIPRPAQPENLHLIIRETLELAAPAARDIPDSPPRSPETEDVLIWTTSQLARCRGVMLRAASRFEADCQLQFVLPLGVELDLLRCEIDRHWGTPLKAEGAGLPSHHRQNPTVRMLWPFATADTLYMRMPQAGSAGGTFYLALLRWRRAARVTIALGWTGTKSAQDPLIPRLRKRAGEELIEFSLPDIPTLCAHVPVVSVPEYNWIVTRTYAGPDRRRRPTPLLDRFILLGRRRHVPSGFRAPPERFVDRLTPRMLVCLFIYLLLSFVDTALTLAFTEPKRGVLREMNVLLRPLLTFHPLFFLVAKNALALVPFVLVTRFQLLRIGQYTLGAVLLGYGLLDAYWVWLLGPWH